MGGVTVRALGAFEVSIGGQPLALAGAKQRAVLAVLALDTNRAVPVGTLLEAVWGEAGDGAEHTLQQHVPALRKLVDPDRGTGSPSDVLVTQAPGYLLRVDESDVEDFERAASAGFAANDAGGAHLLRDLGSTNGTTVNGQVISSQRLEPGDVVGVGGVELVFSAGHDATLPTQ